jgi:hypothetical protein
MEGIPAGPSNIIVKATVQKGVSPTVDEDRDKS